VADLARRLAATVRIDLPGSRKMSFVNAAI